MRTIRLALLLIVLLFSLKPTFGQLSQNSGINSADTWVVYDSTLNFQGTVTGSTLSVSSTQTYHVESGYDSNGGLVLNLQPTGSTGSQLGISMIRFAGGQVTVFDDTGNPFPVVPAASNVGALTLLNLLGIDPGCSPICALVVPNLNTYAQQNTQCPSPSAAGRAEHRIGFTRNWVATGSPPASRPHRTIRVAVKP